MLRSAHRVTGGVRKTGARDAPMIAAKAIARGMARMRRFIGKVDEAAINRDMYASRHNVRGRATFRGFLRYGS